MIEIIRQFFDKKSPLFIITISFLIAAIISLNYQIDPTFKDATQLRKFQVSILIVGIIEIICKTCGMEILKRTCSAHIANLHVAVIIIFILGNAWLYVQSIILNLSFKQTKVSGINSPHQFFLQVYFLVMTIVIVTILGLIISLKLQNKIMTVLQQEQKRQNNQETF